MDLDSYWPQSLKHLASPYDDGIYEDVVIAEIDDQAHMGNKGFRKVSTALVPLQVLDDVLKSRGSIGWEVSSWGPHPCVDNDDVYDTSFWIEGRQGKDERFQTILNGWKHHDQEVILPDSVMLMTYGLVPRYLSNGLVCWDDPRRPAYDVIRAQSHVDYNRKQSRPLVRITMKRDYLEDYCSLKQCAAVAVYYEERFSTDDLTFASVLGGNEGNEFYLPGRLLGLATLKDSYHSDAPQMSRVWGSRLILKPTRRPITDAEDPVLEWPDHPGPMTFERAAGKWLYSYVADAVLNEYEARPEFSLHPESGGVSYGGWWGTSYTDRIGREHIRVELKKLYEGCPPHVIAHWHRFAVSKLVAEHDQSLHGDRNIAVRAKELISSFLNLTGALTDLSAYVGLDFTQEEIGSLTTHEVHYSGWWRLEVMKPLTNVVRLTANRDEFLNRAVSLFKLLELLKPAPLRNTLLEIGIPREQMKDLATLRLLATLCQFVAQAKEHGFDPIADAEHVVPSLDVARPLPVFKRIFALNSLRVAAAHNPGNDKERKISDAAMAFGIDIAAMAGGWGCAIDCMYDGLAADLDEVANLLRSAL